MAVDFTKFVLECLLMTLNVPSFIIFTVDLESIRTRIGILAMETVTCGCFCLSQRLKVNSSSVSLDTGCFDTGCFSAVM